jgi:hypothetical protein
MWEERGIGLEGYRVAQASPPTSIRSKIEIYISIAYGLMLVPITRA